MMRVNIGFHLKTLPRLYCTAAKTKPAKPIVALDDKVSDELQNESYKPRQHPGTDKAKCIELPSRIVKSIFKSLKDAPVKAVHRDAQSLSRYLTARHIPAETNQITLKRRFIEDKLKETMNIDDEDKLRKFQQKVQKTLKGQIYKWEPMVYDRYKSLQYLLGRSAQEYSIIYRIFSEIKNRDPTFTPKSYFDFGPGVGTGIWAASHLWKDSIFEYFLVDSSRDMNDLAGLILRDGDENKHMELKNCPHNMECPRVLAADGTPCNFISSYMPLPLHPENNNMKHEKEMYTYVVLKKGVNEGDGDSTWPRIVRPALVRSKHTICRMCTKNGKLEEVIFTQSKHGKLPYRCARSSKWGDRLPISIDSRSETKTDT